MNNITGIPDANHFSHQVSRLIIYFYLAFLSAPALHAQTLFEDASQAAGLSFTHQALVSFGAMGMGTGAAWLDYDRDGDQDLYVSQGVGPNHFYENNGDGTFTEKAHLLQATDSLHSGGGVAVADFNNDGWPDLFLANGDQDILLKNLNGLSFLDVTEEMGLLEEPANRGVSASWGDFNNDGYLDLFVANHFNLDEHNETHQDRLYVNEAGQQFTDVSHLLGYDNLNAYAFIGSWTDFDDDGDLDLFLINDCGFNRTYTPSRLFRNNGGTNISDWHFEEISQDVEADHCHNGMGIAVGDYDRDGSQEYFYTNIGERTLLLHYENQLFEDVARAAGVYARHPDAHDLWSWGTNFLDYDLDGWLDLYVTAGTLSLRTRTEVDPQPNLLFRNNTDGTFEDVTNKSGLDDPKRSRTSVYADYDNDGDPDLFLVNSNEEAYLFENTLENEHHYLIVDLEGTQSNRDGIGAKLTITTPDGGRQVWETRSGSSLGGGDDRAAYFGLGLNTMISSLAIRWPSGVMQRLENISTNQRILVKEPTSTHNQEGLPLSQSLTIDLFPNPFYDHVQLKLAVPYPTSISCQVFDVLGRLVATPLPHQFVQDSVILKWETAVSPGVYAVRCATEEVHVLKFIVKK